MASRNPLTPLNPIARACHPLLRAKEEATKGNPTREEEVLELMKQKHWTKAAAVVSQSRAGALSSDFKQHVVQTMSVWGRFLNAISVIRSMEDVEAEGPEEEGSGSASTAAAARVSLAQEKAMFTLFFPLGKTKHMSNVAANVESTLPSPLGWKRSQLILDASRAKGLKLRPAWIMYALASARPSNSRQVTSLVIRGLQQLYGVEPDATIYTAVVTLCWEAGLHSRVVQLLDKMKTADTTLTMVQYGRRPVWPLQAMAVESYGRVGRWAEAARAYEAMLVESKGLYPRGRFTQPLAQAVTSLLELGRPGDALQALRLLVYSLLAMGLHVTGGPARREGTGGCHGVMKPDCTWASTHEAGGDIKASTQMRAGELDPSWYAETIKRALALREEGKRWEVAAAVLSPVLLECAGGSSEHWQRTKGEKGGEKAVERVQRLVLPLLEEERPVLASWDLQCFESCLAALRGGTAPHLVLLREQRVILEGPGAERQGVKGAKGEDVETVPGRDGVEGCVGRGAWETSWAWPGVGNQRGEAAFHPLAYTTGPVADSADGQAGAAVLSPGTTRFSLGRSATGGTEVAGPWQKVEPGSSESLCQNVCNHLRQGSVLQALQELDAAEAEAVRVEQVARAGVGEACVSPSAAPPPPSAPHSPPPPQGDVDWMRVAHALDWLGEGHATLMAMEVLSLVEKAEQDGAKVGQTSALFARAMSHGGLSPWGCESGGVMDLTTGTPAVAKAALHLVLTDILRSHVFREKVDRFVHDPAMDLIIIISLAVNDGAHQVVAALEEMLMLEYRGLLEAQDIARGKFRLGVAPLGKGWDYNGFDSRGRERKGIVLEIRKESLHEWLKVEGEASGWPYQGSIVSDISMGEAEPPLPTLAGMDDTAD